MSDGDEASAPSSAAAAAPSPTPARSSAKARAEARRRRILESSSRRLNAVSGEAPKPPAAEAAEPAPAPAPEAEAEAEAEVAATATATATAEDVASGEAASATEGEGGAEADSGPAAASVRSSASGSARMAAMRRRRFKKASAAAPGPEEGKAVDKADDKAEGAGVPEEGKAEDEGTKVGVEAERTDSVAVGGPTAEEEGAGGAPSGDDDGDKKKYLGVAKMRRKRLAEQKKKQEEEAAKAGAGKKAIPPSLSTVAKAAVRRNPTPIVMHLLTTLLIFAASFFFGMKNSVAIGSYNEGLVVTSGIGPLEEGVGILRLVGLGGSDGGKETKGAREALLESTIGDDTISAEEDEFEGIKPAGVAEDEIPKEPDIDPVFQVDLDALTAGPGIFNMVARVAVSCHRFFTWILFLYPMTVMQALLALPRNLLSTPPFLFLVAVICRTVGRTILGASLPDTDGAPGGGDGAEGEGDQPKDLVDMATAFVKGFVARTFPTAIAAYGILREAWADMYVALCGLLLGLVLPSALQRGGAGMQMESESGEEL